MTTHERAREQRSAESAEKPERAGARSASEPTKAMATVENQSDWHPLPSGAPTVGSQSNRPQFVDCRDTVCRLQRRRDVEVRRASTLGSLRKPTKSVKEPWNTSVKRRVQAVRSSHPRKSPARIRSAESQGAGSRTRAKTIVVLVPRLRVIPRTPRVALGPDEIGPPRGPTPE